MTDLLNGLAHLTSMLIIPGLAYGSQLALGALGVTLIFGVLRFSSFAHAEGLSMATAVTILFTIWLQGMGVSLGVLPTALLGMGLAMPAMALVFIGIPFVVRTVQPVIEEIEQEVEEASATLGASRLHTLRHVILPMLTPAALTGFALSLARAVGEYGSVIFIAGNIPLRTEIAPLLIVIQLEEFNYDAAAAIGIAMLVISFVMLLAINLIQIVSRRRMGHV